MTVVFAGGQDRRVSVAENAKILDAKGKDLADGLKSKELKEGAEVILTVEREDNRPVIKAIQLGKRRAGQANQNPPDKVDLAKLKPLKLSKVLSKAALNHTRAMIGGKFFAHQGPKELALVTLMHFAEGLTDRQGNPALMAATCSLSV